MKELEQGLQKFQTEVFPQHQQLYSDLAKGQHPRILFITCCDSRIVPYMITQQQPGALFVMRNPGNVVPPYRSNVVCSEAATLEYAISILKIPQIVICGHTHCGAIEHIVHHNHHHEEPDVHLVDQWLKYTDLWENPTTCDSDLPFDEEVLAATVLNVQHQMLHLMSYPFVQEALNQGRLAIHGWLYNLETGQITQVDPPPMALDKAS